MVVKPLATETRIGFEPWLDFHFGNRVSKESGIVLVLLCLTLWLVQKPHTSSSTNQIQNENQSQIGLPRFLAPQSVFLFLFWVLTGSPWCFIFLLLIGCCELASYFLCIIHSTDGNAQHSCKGTVREWRICSRQVREKLFFLAMDSWW